MANQYLDEQNYEQEPPSEIYEKYPDGSKIDNTYIEQNFGEFDGSSSMC